MKTRGMCILTILLALPSGGLWGQDIDGLGSFAAQRPDRPWLLDAKAAESCSQVVPGEKFHVALDLRLAPGWFFYGPDPGPVVLAGGLNVTGGPFKALRTLWPIDQSHTFAEGSATLTNFGYEGHIVLFQEFQAPQDAVEGTYTIRLGPSGQACSTGASASCVSLDHPAPFQASVMVMVGPSSIANPQWREQYAPGLAEAISGKDLQARHAAATTLQETGASRTAAMTVWTGLGLALLAGLILNVMPCVLPVIPLKVLSIVHLAGQSRRRFVVLGLAFAGGIMLFFLALAVFSAALRIAGNHAFNWGEHFQSVPFRIAMALLLAAVAANLFGLFAVAVPSRVASLAANQAPGGHRYGDVISAAGSGVLTAILSTPCSFAILTLALAWAQTQPPAMGSLAILTIGAGMAVPYALLAAFPKLVARLPRPGRWMELFKQSMGFVLLLVAIWLIGSFSDQAYPLWVTAYATVLVFCLWVWGSWVRYDAPLRRKLAIRGPAVVLAVLAGAWMLRPPQPPAVTMEPFDEARIDQARRMGRTVVVDFTANWCLTCKTVEAWVYDNAEVARELSRRNVLVMKGDVTTADLPANKMLTEVLKEPGVPVTVIFPPIAPGSDPPQPIRLRGIFKRSELIDALNSVK